MTQTVDEVQVAAVSSTMRAIGHRQYGEPDVLVLEEVARPIPGADEVLVQVYAAGVSIGDHHVVAGTPWLIRLSPYGGLPRPRNRIPGMAMAGRVDAVGANVTAFRPGDEVFGDASTGAFAEYVAVPARLLAHKPSNLSFDEAAATPWAVAPLQGLRDVGMLQPGQRVLINGASGGVGTWAIQIAKALGAEVTAVCSTRNVEMVRALGADEVIDYTRQDFVQGGSRFHVLLDNVGNRSLAECRSVLRSDGTYIACYGGESSIGFLYGAARVLVRSLFASQRLKVLVTTPNQKDLLYLKELVEAGKMKPVIERRYGLGDVAAALRHVGEGHAQGQTVLHIAG